MEAMAVVAMVAVVMATTSIGSEVVYARLSDLQVEKYQDQRCICKLFVEPRNERKRLQRG